MKQTKFILPISIVASILIAPAEAEIIQINNASGSVQLHSQSMELLSSTSPYLSTTDLSIAHSALSDWGISTDGKITILPVNTSQGLSLFTIIDDELGGGDTGSDASLGLITTASSTLGMFINDADQDSWELIGSPFGSQTLGATFSWDSSGSGDGFAWTDLTYGDAVSYSFTDLDAKRIDHAGPWKARNVHLDTAVRRYLMFGRGITLNTDDIAVRCWRQHFEPWL